VVLKKAPEAASGRSDVLEGGSRPGRCTWILNKNWLSPHQIDVRNVQSADKIGIPVAFVLSKRKIKAFS
jgi:hypothetical protein